MEKSLEIDELPDIDTQIEYMKRIRLGMGEKKSISGEVQMIFAIEQTLLAAKILHQTDQTKSKEWTSAYDLSAILRVHKIRITSTRLEILNAITGCAGISTDFTMSEIKQMISGTHRFSKSAIIATVLLFKARGIINNAPHFLHYESKRKQGRPEKRFKLNHALNIKQYAVVST